MAQIQLTHDYMLVATCIGCNMLFIRNHTQPMDLFGMNLAPKFMKNYKFIQDFFLKKSCPQFNKNYLKCVFDVLTFLKGFGVLLSNLPLICFKQINLSSPFDYMHLRFIINQPQAPSQHAWKSCICMQARASQLY